jgi:signal transduction histidine kinase
VVGAGDLAQSKRLEQGLVRVRWFGVALGVYLISQTNSSPPFASRSVILLGYALMAAMALGNLAIWYRTSRARTLADLRRIGFLAYLFDAAVILSLAWLYSYDPTVAVWVVIFVLPLEGAIRYELKGALWSVALALLSETGREAYLAFRFPTYAFLVSNIAFRVGVDAIIGLVAGYMARSLAREAERASEQAARFEEVARREAAARKELAAFNTAILMGVAAEDLEVSLKLMSEAIARELGFEALSIMILEEGELQVRGAYGVPDPFRRMRVPVGTGITGTVARTGRALVVPDVRGFPDYVPGDPRVRSEMAAPLRIGDETVGVLDVQSHKEAAFDQGSTELLTRVADQIALVVHSNLLLSQQRETVERLRELDQMKSDFIAITSHELRTPLTAIRGYVHTLLRRRDQIPDEQATKFMEIIDRQTHRLARLVEDLLVVSRIEAGTMRLTADHVDLRRFLEQTVESFGPEAGARIELSVGEETARVVVDSDRLDQIVRNLVENALKFSPPDSAVRIEAARDDAEMRLTVSDRGQGIPPQALPHIFDRFHQAGEVLTRDTEGAGLGLYITKRLVEAMGGTIEVSSEMGKGSTFRVSLPVGTPPEEEPGQEEPSDARREPKASTSRGN